MLTNHEIKGAPLTAVVRKNVHEFISLKRTYEFVTGNDLRMSTAIVRLM